MSPTEATIPSLLFACLSVMLPFGDRLTTDAGGIPT
jgi:hypothetical protein